MAWKSDYYCLVAELYISVLSILIWLLLANIIIIPILTTQNGSQNCHMDQTKKYAPPTSA